MVADPLTRQFAGNLISFNVRMLQYPNERNVICHSLLYYIIQALSDQLRLKATRL